MEQIHALLDPARALIMVVWIIGYARKTNKNDIYMKTLIVTILTVFVIACAEEEEYHQGARRERCDPADRTGCICKDGTQLTSTDPAVCDPYGGFERFKCKWD